MFELPSRRDVSKCVITKETIENGPQADARHERRRAATTSPKSSPKSRPDPGGASAPAFSVILPTRDRRELTRRAVASVLAQTCRDFELIVVDGGSTDGTPEALAAVLGPRVRLLVEPGASPARARNVALAGARGELVAFLDSDNWWLPDHLAVLAEVLERNSGGGPGLDLPPGSGSPAGRDRPGQRSPTRFRTSSS